MPDCFSGPARVVQPGAFIFTRSGHKWGPAYPPPPLEDIAVSLGRLCRFVGHCNRFWSVLQHSFVVADLVQEMDKSAALLHDSCEGMLNDTPTPFKTPETQALEHRMLMRVLTAYLTPEEQLGWIEGGYARVKAADEEAFLGEVHVLGTPALRDLFPGRSSFAEKRVRHYLKKYPVQDVTSGNGLAILDFVRKAQ